MENIYLIMIIALGVLAIADLVVGVSNDAVNFLNSAIGSKAIPFKTIMIIASVGILFGALSSSGMMDIARNGIFVPEKFFFEDIMVIFMAVMITDILLLDFFNSLGLPTSTTVSIVFELLGAAVCISLIKLNADGQSFAMLGEYINTDKATEIIYGILLSVVIAFTVGALVQFVARYLLTFNFHKKATWVSSLFGGTAITGIMYFIIVKGLKSTQILPEFITSWANESIMMFLLANLLLWTIVAWVVTVVIKFNIYKLIIILGTFALAMAFAGNDLVNFIGVPMAGLEAYRNWESSGISASTFTMESLSIPVRTNQLLLLVAGVVMILTLWFSEKARRVVKTEVDLATQDTTKERFSSNWFSQNLVRGFILANRGITYVLPKSLLLNIDTRFNKPDVKAIQNIDAPAFDMVRAAVNLMIASVLISVATSMKLPLSTTYVTFMVAMGSSLADRAWGSDSAVYRVAGVLNVIAGWFMTAITAFGAAAILAAIIYYFEGPALAVFFVFAIIMIIRNYIKGRKKTTEFKEELALKRAESNTVRGIIEESAKNVSAVMKRGTKLLSNTIDNLAKQDQGGLKRAKKQGEKLTDEMEDLQNHVFYYIKNLDDSSSGASRFYLLIHDSLQDIVQSLTFISNTSYKHVKNNHKGLKYNQIKDLKEIEQLILSLFEKIKEEFDNLNMASLPGIIEKKQEIINFISDDIEKQILRTKDPKSSPKNTSLYFSILLECRDLVEATTYLLEQYYTEHVRSKKTL